MGSEDRLMLTATGQVGFRAVHSTLTRARLAISRPAIMKANGDTTKEKQKATGQAIMNELAQASTMAGVKPR